MRRTVLVALAIVTLVGGEPGAAPTAGPKKNVAFARPGGRCDAAFPPLAPRPWLHPHRSPLTVAIGEPNHRLRDLVLAPAESSELRARFTYGSVDKDLAHERVTAWLRRCPGWEALGEATTDEQGVATIKIPADVPAGDYRVRVVVGGDGTFAEGTIAVWRRATPVVVTDIDGTLTTSDGEVRRGLDGAMYDHASDVMRAWADKGHRILYMTGRPQYLNRMTRQWLEKRGFPPGPLFLTDEVKGALPTEEGVGRYKTARLEDLIRRVGISIAVAYGNATTDILAYAAVGIAKASTFIIGPNAGLEQTIALPSYTAHLPSLAAFPAAVEP